MEHYSVTIIAAAPDKPYLAESGNVSIDWEWIVEWADIVNQDTMVFCRYGENTFLPKAAEQIQQLCQNGGSSHNVFDITMDCKISSDALIVFSSSRQEEGVQV